ncbi:MAG: hypothetical protein KBE65_05020 [Phycisphaerae bacterium]|nr:hypothetical protein [Phycisphaerae bacterium]
MMKTIRMSVLTTCVLLLAGVASADTVTIKHTMNYLDNDWAAGVWFVEEGTILDHSPYCRNTTEDWGWTHVVTDNIPKGATGIESATVTIIAWNIDVAAGEDDMIYALAEPAASTTEAKTNGTELGILNSYLTSPITVEWASMDGDSHQINGYEDLWSTTTFELTADMLEDLWTNGEISFYMNIDATGGNGMRATLESAVLEIDYIAPKPEVTYVNIHRFWSESLRGHFYTASEDEANFVIDNYAATYEYEGVVYIAMADDSDPMSVPVYRFYSPTGNVHFYTADAGEANFVIDNYSGTWTYEGIVFYVYPSDYQPDGASPVYRFYSSLLSRHFYTINEDEMNFVCDNYSAVWTYEGIVWYAFAP